MSSQEESPEDSWNRLQEGIERDKRNDEIKFWIVVVVLGALYFLWLKYG